MENKQLCKTNNNKTSFSNTIIMQHYHLSNIFFKQLVPFKKKKCYLKKKDQIITYFLRKESFLENLQMNMP